MSARQLSRVVRETAREAGIASACRPTLAVTARTHLLEQNVDIRVIQVYSDMPNWRRRRLHPVAVNTIRDVASPLEKLKDLAGAPSTPDAR